jgi:hypothetical protein
MGFSVLNNMSRFTLRTVQHLGFSSKIFTLLYFKLITSLALPHLLGKAKEAVEPISSF